MFGHFVHLLRARAENRILYTTARTTMLARVMPRVTPDPPTAARTRTGRPVCAATVATADLADTPVTANILLPGGATATGLIPDEMPDELRDNLLEPSIMGPPIV
jgi:hypothetical protein